MPSDRQLLNWLDSTVRVNARKRQESRQVRFYWGSYDGGFRLLEMPVLDDTFPTAREALVDAMSRDEGEGLTDMDSETRAAYNDTAEIAPSCPVDEESGEVDALPDAGPARGKHDGLTQEEEEAEFEKDDARFRCELGEE